MALIKCPECGNLISDKAIYATLVFYTNDSGDMMFGRLAQMPPKCF